MRYAKAYPFSLSTPDRMAASYRTVMEAKGKRARAGAVLREGGSSAARSLFDNARIARAYLKK